MDLTFGGRLRAQRESQQLALAAIAEETKINLALLDGLERDDLSRWPGGLFRRAYVRTYAQKIGLDPEQVVREFTELYPDPVAEASPVEAIAQNAQGKRPKTRIGLMIAGLAGLRPQRREAPPQRPEVPRRVVTPETFAMDERRSGVPGDLGEAASVPEPIVETPAPVVELDLGALAEMEAPVPRLVMIPSPDANGDLRRDVQMLERDVAATARLCTRIASAQDQGDLACVLEETVEMLDAVGAILWAWDPDRDVLFPVLAHGYPDELLTRLPEVRRCADNAIAAVLRCGQQQVVGGAGDATGAFVAPLLTPGACAGVLALEFANGAEQDELVQTLATIITAQFSTLFSATSQAINEEWARPHQSLVAS
jgi:transcriptional regulator with XRE-family HTH domain